MNKSAENGNIKEKRQTSKQKSSRESSGEKEGNNSRQKGKSK